jgi:N-acetylglucosaminyl-diphospho-decaprenol L-rhamnosyltransferase
MAQSTSTVAVPLAGPASRHARAFSLCRVERESTQTVDVSVCLVNWNCRDYLYACLRSLLQERQGVALEVIVVDNGSRDGAPDMVEKEFPDVTLIRNAVNRGFSAANNQAARLATGRYLFFLNNDTVVSPGTLQSLLRYADVHPEIGIIGPRLRNGDGEVQASCRQRPTVSTFLHRTTLLRWTRLLRPAYHEYRRQGFDSVTTRRVGLVLGAAMFMPREVFESCGGWDEEFTFGGEDLELSARVARTHDVVYLPTVEITHFGRVSTRRHVAYAAEHIFCGFARYLRKTGCSRRALFGYKLAMTLDAPVQLVEKGVQFLWRRAWGRKEKAAKSLLVFLGLIHFIRRGLLPLWKV